jgi:hypothetical protein
MFKVSSASLQTLVDTPNCVLEDRVQYSTVHIPNVLCDGLLQIINFCTAIVRCTDTFWSPCTFKCYLFMHILNHLHFEFNCRMLYKMIITDVICYVLASFKFGLWTPWGWHRRAETRRSNSCKWPTLCTILFSICLFQFSTCSEQPRAHHQENQLYQYNIWYVSLWVGDRLVCSSGSSSPPAY